MAAIGQVGRVLLPLVGQRSLAGGGDGEGGGGTEAYVLRSRLLGDPRCGRAPPALDEYVVVIGSGAGGGVTGSDADVLEADSTGGAGVAAIGAAQHVIDV